MNCSLLRSSRSRRLTLYVCAVRSSNIRIIAKSTCMAVLESSDVRVQLPMALHKSQKARERAKVVGKILLTTNTGEIRENVEMPKPHLIKLTLLLSILKCNEAFHIFGGNNKRAIVATSFQKIKNHDLLPYLVTKSYSSNTILYAGNEGGKKKRRRKKTGTTETAPQEISVEVSSDVKIDITSEKEEVNVVSEEKLVEEVVNEEKDPVTPETKEGSLDNTIDASMKTPTFKFDRNEAIALGISDADEDDDDDTLMPLADMKGETVKSKVDLSKGAIELPDLKETVKKKKVVEAIKKQKEEIVEDKPSTKKISRKDTESFKQLLEIEPQADSDKTFFEEEQYGAVSALLAEGAKPFLGIPSNVLQVGHFFGAISFFIMAFIQYPGFPLTNLPTPLRDAFQGGLLTTYAINLVLAGLSVFEAPKRGQPSTLWAVKTFTLGGLAYDQLTQLPTKEEIERQKSIKGKRGRRR